MVDVSTLGRALQQIESIKSQQAQFSSLSEQLTTGKKTQRFAGLGTDDVISLRGRTEIRLLQTYVDSIDRGDIRIQTINRKIEEFEAQTSSFADSLVEFPRNGTQQKGSIVTYDDPATFDVVETLAVGFDSAELGGDLSTLKNFASNLYEVLSGILNFQDGGDYVFAGSASETRPFNDSGTLETSVSNLLAQWKDGSIGNQELLRDITDRTTADGNTNALTDSLVGYSSELSSGNTQGVFIRADDNAQVEYTALGNEDGFRNALVALAVISSDEFGPVHDVYIDNEFPAAPDVQGAPGTTIQQQSDNFYEVFQGLSNLVVDAIDQLQNTRTRLDQARVQINAVKTSHVEDINLFQATVDDVENVDINEVALRITTLQTSLQASFSVTSLLRDLTLTNFI